MWLKITDLQPNAHQMSHLKSPPSPFLELELLIKNIGKGSFMLEQSESRKLTFSFIFVTAHCKQM